jgi:hypothetical protein
MKMITKILDWGSILAYSVFPLVARISLFALISWFVFAYSWVVWSIWIKSPIAAYVIVGATTFLLLLARGDPSEQTFSEYVKQLKDEENSNDKLK